MMAAGIPNFAHAGIAEDGVLSEEPNLSGSDGRVGATGGGVTL